MSIHSLKKKCSAHLKNNHPVAFLLLKIIYRRNYPREIKFLLDTATNPNFVCLERNQDATISKTIFVIDIGGRYGGFCALLFRVLDGLYFCDYYQQDIVIKYADTVLYKDDDITQTDNAFEYYFQQPAGILSKDLENISVLAHVSRHNFDLAHDLKARHYASSGEYLDAISLMAKKYLHFNEKTQVLIDEELRHRAIPRNTLGVHIRGSDYKSNFNGHPTFVPVEKYIEVIDAAIKSHGFSKIFLATDDMDILSEMLAYYGEEKLLYAKDVLRASGEEGVHTTTTHKREFHQYLLGLEVLYDVCALAECDGFISGLSNVSTFTRVYKKSKDESFLFEETIDLGVNTNTKKAAKRIAKKRGE